MYIGFFCNYNFYNQNRMLRDPSSPIGDNLMYPVFYLAKQLEKLGHKTATIDTDNIEKFDAVVFFDFPTLKNKYFKKLIKLGRDNVYLLVMESPLIKPDNLNQENHTYFKKIFTWDDNIIDNKKYFKINYSHSIPTEFDFNLAGEKKLCAIISGNKYVRHPAELYTERIKAIRWFEKNHPDEFDLYGTGWDRYNFYGEFLGIKLARLNRLKFLTKLLAPDYPSNKGTVMSKNKTYKNYKFAVCYENAKGFDGYITEKIFDCFFAGCIPIYLGAPNISEHIPSNCFVNKKNFKTYEELYGYIKNMPSKEYLNYLNAIKNFLKSDKAYPFSAEHFAETIIREII